jgi:hypothetical protein
MLPKSSALGVLTVSEKDATTKQFGAIGKLGLDPVFHDLGSTQLQTPRLDPNFLRLVHIRESKETKIREI